MNVLLAVYFTAAGMVVSSFCNAAGMRMAVGESVWMPPSQCPVCVQPIKKRDLVPCCSYLYLGGKCRFCKTRISAIYPLMEGAGGVLFFLAYVRFGPTAEFAAALLLISYLFIITISDITAMIIPDRVSLLFFLGAVLLKLFWLEEPAWNESFIGALAGFFLLSAIILVTRGGMGGGDLKIFTVLGFFFGPHLLAVNFTAAVFTASIVIFLLYPFNAFKKGTPFPFAPAIAVGSLFTLFTGEACLKWYLAFL